MLSSARFASAFIPRTSVRKLTVTHRMSTSRFEWLCQIPDKPNALEKRLAARPIHLENLKPRIESGQAVFGGATLTEQPSVDGTPSMTGSVMLIKADTKDEVMDILKNDVYAQKGVWDVDKAVVVAFKSALRTAL